MKAGDKVRIARVSDYNAMLYKSTNTPSPIGETGVVIETRFNPNMARYGQGNEVLVRMDKDGGKALWIEEHLEVIN